MNNNKSHCWSCRAAGTRRRLGGEGENAIFLIHFFVKKPALQSETYSAYLSFIKSQPLQFDNRTKPGHALFVQP